MPRKKPTAGKDLRWAPHNPHTRFKSPELPSNGPCGFVLWPIGWASRSSRPAEPKRGPSRGRGSRRSGVVYHMTRCGHPFPYRLLGDLSSSDESKAYRPRAGTGSVLWRAAAKSFCIAQPASAVTAGVNDWRAIPAARQGRGRPSVRSSGKDRRSATHPAAARRPSVRSPADRKQGRCCGPLGPRDRR